MGGAFNAGTIAGICLLVFFICGTLTGVVVYIYVKQKKEEAKRIRHITTNPDYESNLISIHFITMFNMN